MVVLMIRKADRIENQVIMNMLFVYVSGKYKFILACLLYTSDAADEL